MIHYAVLGGGNMGSSLIQGMILSGMLTYDQITLSSRTPDSSVAIASHLGVKAAHSNAEAVREADVIFLCVKPHQSLEVLRNLTKDLKKKLILSVVAGIRSSALLAEVGVDTKIIRVMPNIAVRLGKGITAIAKNASTASEDLEHARKIFSYLGSVLEVKEEDLDTVTALSGSGPAFALLFLEAITQVGIEGGLDQESAKFFATGTLATAVALLQETGETPQSLCAKISSPRGTTEAGLAVLEKAGFIDIVRNAVHAARKRSIELSRIA